MEPVKKSLYVLVCAALFALGVTVAGTAQAEGLGNPVITGPADGSKVANGYTGPITVDFSDAPADSYFAELSCGDYAYYESHTFSYDGSSKVQTWTAPRISGPASCTLTVDNYTGNEASSTFSVSAPPQPALVLSGASISPYSFYPVVHDGYRDSTVMTYRLNRSAHVVARVRSSSGSVVRSVDLGTRYTGNHSWSWNGRKNDGSLARTGKYELQISATAGSTKSIYRHAVVTSTYRTSTVSKYRSGDVTSSTHRTSSCYVDRYSYSGELELDCWGGSYATANYRVSVPANAHNVTWSVSGYQGCCDEGTIHKTGTRESSTTYRVSVKVTDWRSYTITRVKVTYTYKHRI